MTTFNNLETSSTLPMYPCNQINGMIGALNYDTMGLLRDRIMQYSLLYVFATGFKAFRVEKIIAAIVKGLFL